MKINKTTSGLLGLITILTLFGGSLYLSPEQLDNAYYCTATEEIGIFYGGVSGTGLTAYPYNENRSDSVRCKKAGIKGTWISLIKYAEEQGVDPMLIINEEPKLNLTGNSKIIIINYPNNKIYECISFNEFLNNSLKTITNCELLDN